MNLSLIPWSVLLDHYISISELCREYGMSNASFCKWRSKYGGMDASLMARMKELEDENRRLKKSMPRND